MHSGANAADQGLKYPKDEFAERALLGAMIVSPGAAQEAKQMGVRPWDFYSDSHKVISETIFRALDERDGRGVGFNGIDITELLGRLEQSGELRFVGGALYLSSLLDGVPERTDASEYIRTVKKFSKLRTIQGICLKAAKEVGEPHSEPDLLIPGLMTKLSGADLSPEEEPVKHVKNGTQEYLDMLEAVQGGKLEGGISSGYHELDECIGAFRPGLFYLIAGRATMGKTAVAINLIQKMAIDNNRGVLFFTMEMSSDEIAERFLKLETSLKNEHVFKPNTMENNDWDEVNREAGRLTKSSLFLDHSPILTIEDLVLRTKRHKIRHNLDIVFIDYIQLLRTSKGVGKGSNYRVLELSEISRALKALAKELRIPVVAMAQLNRNIDGRRGTSRVKQKPKPKYFLSDLKDCGSLEQDADAVIFLHRDEVVDPDTVDKNRMDIMIMKQRNGPLTNLKFEFSGEKMKLSPGYERCLENKASFLF